MAMKFTVPRSSPTVLATIGASFARRRTLAGVSRTVARRSTHSRRVDEHHVRQALHHGAGDADGMEVARERADGTDAVRRSVDERGIELDDTEHVGFATAADAGIRRIRFDHARAGLDRIEGRAAPPQHRDTRGQARRAVAARDDDRSALLHLSPNVRMSLVRGGHAAYGGEHVSRTVFGTT
jgi:hypothetical protein